MGRYFDAVRVLLYGEHAARASLKCGNSFCSGLRARMMTTKAGSTDQ
jgi:hypothetical protein